MKEFTKSDTLRSMFDDSPDEKIGNAGMVCILPLSFFEKQYRKPEFQLFRVQHGFGAEQPKGSGRACYGYFCYDGEKCRCNREDFIGVGNDEIQRTGAQLESVWTNTKNNEQEMS